MKPEEVHLIVPGPIDQRTGGYLYDARMATGLERLGWTVVVHSLDGDFPGGDARAEESLAGALAGLPQGARVLIDGLAMGALPGPIIAHAPRLRVLALVHHALADETGLDEAQKSRLEALEREALSACLGMLCTSAFTATRMGAYGIPPEQVRAVLPGTEPARPAMGPAEGEPPLLLCVGTVVPRKGQDLLVRALARLRHIRWNCVCAGSLDRAPGYASTVRALAVEEGLDDRIAFTGGVRPAGARRPLSLHLSFRPTLSPRGIRDGARRGSGTRATDREYDGRGGAAHRPGRGGDSGDSWRRASAS